MRKRLSLRLTWERIRNVPGLTRNLLTLVVVGALGLSSLWYILTHQRFIPAWSDRYVFYADFAEAPAVNPGQQPKVRIAGVEVGQITGSTVTQAGKARLRLSLKPGNPIYRNARLVLRPTNPLNEMYVEVNPGGPPADRLPEDGVVPVNQTSRPIQTDEVLNHLDDRSRAALSNLLSASDVALAHAPTHLPDGLNATDAALVRFQPVLESLRKRRAEIAKLVTALARISEAVGRDDARLTRLMEALDHTLASLSRRDTDLRATLAKLPGTTDALRRAMTGVQGLTAELDPALDNIEEASAQLPATLRALRGVVNDLDRTVTAARPVVSAAGPVVANLRPQVRDVRVALGDLEPVTRDLIPDTKLLVSYLDDLSAFIYNTNGTFSLSDANGGMIRGHVAVPLPDAGVIPGSHGGNTGQAGEGGR